MKKVFGLLVILAVGVYSYETEADNIDLDSIMANDEHSRALLHCVLEKITCMEITKHEIDILQDAITTGCVRCKSHQKNRLHQFLTGVKEKFPEDYEVFKQKYDPDNVYIDRFEEILREHVEKTSKK